MNPLGGGMIPNNADRLEFIKGPNDKNVVQAAIRFNISQPSITSALVGFTTREHVDEAVSAVESFQPYDASHVKNIKSKVTESFNGFCTMCGYCLPCPANVDVPRLMEAYNHKILTGSGHGIRARLKWHWGVAPETAAACLDCGQCEEQCTQRLPIRERLP